MCIKLLCLKRKKAIIVPQLLNENESSWFRIFARCGFIRCDFIHTFLETEHTAVCSRAVLSLHLQQSLATTCGVYGVSVATWLELSLVFPLAIVPCVSNHYAYKSKTRSLSIWSLMQLTSVKTLMKGTDSKLTQLHAATQFAYLHLQESLCEK